MPHPGPTAPPSTTSRTSRTSLSAPWSALTDRAVRRARAWSVESQQTARRNAMVACTALAARRREREDVEEFLEALAGAPTGTDVERAGATRAATREVRHR